MNHHSCIPACLREIDGILRRLSRLGSAYQERAADLAPRIDAALDERLRLMRLRDLPLSRNTNGPEPSTIAVQ